MSIQMSCSSEMMSQYLQDEIIGPGKQFQAVQAADGHSLLFSISSTDDIFYLLEETTAVNTGWQSHNLSEDLQQKLGTQGVAKDFFVAQDPNGTAFALLLVVTVGEADLLYFANAYTRDADTHALSFNWNLLTFDAPNPSRTLTIQAVYSAVAEGIPMGVVDVVGEQDQQVDRYYIDPTKEVASHYWTPYNLPFDMSATDPVKLCNGRRKGAKVDGLYTLGLVGGQAAVVFQEYFDYYGDGAAPPSRLDLPSGIAPQALASIPSAATPADKDGPFTDLYVTGSDGGLYFFEASSQQDLGQAQLLYKNDLFKEVDTLYAYRTDERVIVWGLNRAQQVFYTQAALGAVAQGSAWSLPLALGTGVEQISPYVNRVNGGNTYFAHTGQGELKKIFQDPATTLWTRQNITVPAPPNSSAQKFDAYTTQVALTDENNQPITDASIWVGSSQRMPVYINYHYYILDQTPIAVPVDAQGKLYILQRTEALVGAQLILQDEGGQLQLTVNPMQNTAEQFFTLTTADDLKVATVTDDKGENPQSLVPSTASDADIQAAADALQALSSAYADLDTDTAAVQSAPSTTMATFAVRRTPKLQLSAKSAMGDLADAVVVAAGDLFSWLEDATDYVIHIVQDAATAVWNFVCEIGGKVLTFVIETIEQVIAAIQAVLQALESLVKVIIQFVKFLFSWSDIELTKDVLKQLTLLSLQAGLDKIDDLQATVDQALEDAQDAVNIWAGLPSQSGGPSLDSMAQNSDDSSANSAPNDYLQYYLTNNLDGATTTDEDAGMSDDQVNLIQTLLEGLEAEEAVVEGTCQAFYNQIIADGQYKTMSLLELFQKSIAIVADALLQTAEVVFDTVLQLIKGLGQYAIKALDTPIYIPVLSDILEEFFDYEIGFSILDVVLLVTAIPVTLTYKILASKAPFSEDDPATQAILNATDWSSALQALEDIVDEDKLTMQTTLFKIGRLCTGVLNGIRALLVIPANLPGVKRIFAKIQSLIGVLVTAINVLVKEFSNPAPLKDETFKTLHTIIKDLSKLASLVFFALSFYTKKKDPAMTTGVKIIGTTVGVVLKGVDLLSVGYHAYEVIRDFDDYPVQAGVALMECGVSFSAFGNSVAELALKVTPSASITASSVEVGFDVGFYLLRGLLEVGQTVVVEIAD